MVYLSDRRRKRPRAEGRAARKRTSETRESRLDEVFFALSHASRRRLLARLGEFGAQPVAPLARPLRESPAQITKHLAILERAGLITRRIEGREHRVRLDPRGIRPALDWVARHRQFWSVRVDRLEQFLDAIEDDE
jgi:DNA-binding transcriptional ArsR family regulator